MNQGIIHIISAPSGTGKSSLLQALLKTKSLYNAKISVSHTTRKIRSGEINGKHYFFVSKLKFEAMIAQNSFLEYAEIYGHYYGTSRIVVDILLSTGIDIFLDIDWQGAQQIRQKIPNVNSIFILPPSLKELNRRIRSRGKDSEDVIIQRMEKAIEEIHHYRDYNYLIVNNNFSLALSDLKSIVHAEKLRIKCQTIRINNLISKLLAR